MDAFRLGRVAVHPRELDAVRFVTSGTTAATSGVHPMRTTATYRELSVRYGRAALSSAAPGRRTVVALAPFPGEPATSSLGFMMRAFMEDFDGAALGPDGPFDATAERRWLASSAGVDVDGLRRAVEAARRRGEPLVVLATAFALVLLCESLDGTCLDAPEGSVVMPTGGTKGKTRDVAPSALVRDVARAFGVPASQVVGEYGMTELSSQLYEGTLPGGALAGPRGVFLPPPWLEVVPVDPMTLAPVPDGSPGIARFVDLANVDSAVAIVTQDRVRRDGPGIVLEGRLEGAPARGCSLALEEMVLGGGDP